MRKASLDITYNGVDISEDIADMILNFSSTDHSDGKADDLQITVEDTGQLWKNSWYPQKGAVLTPVIVCENCFQTGDRLTLAAGIFEIDGISASGPPETVTMKAVSSPVTKSMRREKKNKAWEAITLQEIAGEIAATHGLSLFYSADTVNFDRLGQREESDLSFLRRISRENGLSLKIASEKIIIFSGKDIESQPSSFVFDKSHEDLKTYSFSSKTHDIFSACTVKYWDADAKEEKFYTFFPPSAPPVGQILQINRRVESLAEAQRRAISELRRTNKEETKGTMDFVGHPGLQAGLNIDLTGFGVFSGKYFIDEARHTQTIGTGYSTNIKIHKVLGY